MGNRIDDREMETHYNRFMGSFVENRDPRIDLETGALRELQGIYLERAKAAILERLKKSPSSDAISCARVINLTEAVPLLEKWLEEVRLNPASKHRSHYVQGELALALYEFTGDESYIPEVINTVQKEGYSDFEYGVYWLSRMPLSLEGITAVWEKYKRGKVIKEPYSWRESCASFLRESIKQPIGQNFFNNLPDEEQKELLDLIGESYHQRLERKFRLEKYIYGRERYKKEDVNRYDEYIQVGGSPVKGMTLKALWKGHTAGIVGFNWSPDGRYLASCSKDDALRIWEADSGQPVKVLQQKKDYPYSRTRPEKIAWTSRTGERIAVVYDNFQTASSDKYQLIEWDILSGRPEQPLYRVTDYTPVSNLVYLFRQEAFLLGFWNAFHLLDRKTGQHRQILKEYNGRFGPVSLSPNGRVLAIAYNDFVDPKTGEKYSSGVRGEGIPYEVLIYGVDSQKVVHRFVTGHIQNIYDLCWMPDQAILAVASADNSISIWNLKENRRVALLESQGFVGSITGLAFSANGALLASKSDKDNLMRVWRTDTWEEVFAFRELNNGSSFSFHPSLPILASVCSLREPDDYSSEESHMAIRLWEFDDDTFLSNPPFMQEFNQREAEIRSGLLRQEITEDLEYVRPGGSPAKGLRLRRVLKGHSERIHQISWSPDGSYLASTSDDKMLRIWDGESGTVLSTFEEKDSTKRCSWSPDGKILVYGGDNLVRLWENNAPGPVTLLENNLNHLDSLAFSSDGTMLALACGYDTILILDTSTWQEVNRKVLQQRSSCPIHVQWSDDGRQIVICSAPGFLQVLDVEDWRLARVIALPEPVEEPYSSLLTYTKFGDLAAVSQRNRPISIFNLRSGQLEKEFSEATSYASGLAFAPDGKILVSWCHDSAIYFWGVESGQKLARLHEYSLRIIEPVFPVFHPTRPCLATYCDKRRSIRIWEIDSQELLG